MKAPERIPEETKTRLTHIDLLESLAIFFVLAYHGCLMDSDFIARPEGKQYFQYFARMILSTCVPMFLFVNGYLLFSRPLDIRKHVKKMIRLTVVTCIWILLLLVIMQPIYGEYLTWEQIGEQFWYLKMDWNNHLWYMGTLICLYVFFPVMKQTFDTNRSLFYWFTAICAVLTLGNTLINQFVTVFNYVVLHKVEVYQGFNFFHMFNPFQYTIKYAIVYFCAGGIAWAWQERIEAIPLRRRNGIALAGLAVGCILLGILGIGYSILTKTWVDGVFSGYDTVFTFWNVLCLFVLSLNWKKDWKLLRLISGNTLGIYFIHDVFNRMLRPYAAAVPGMKTLPGTVLYAAALLMICLCVCLVIKKIPVLKKLI